MDVIKKYMFIPKVFLLVLALTMLETTTIPDLNSDELLGLMVMNIALSFLVIGT
jgi:hypothetical protein